MIVSLTAAEYAEKLRVYDCVQIPIAIDGFLYMVIRGEDSANIYRTGC